MTNLIDRRIARVEAHLARKDPFARPHILWAKTSEDVERYQRENPNAMIIHWKFEDPTEQRL
jgi:hypothetical protein